MKVRINNKAYDTEGSNTVKYCKQILEVGDSQQYNKLIKTLYEQGNEFFFHIIYNNNHFTEPTQIQERIEPIDEDCALNFYSEIQRQILQNTRKEVW